jgi:hypothetical protein
MYTKIYVGGNRDMTVSKSRLSPPSMEVIHRDKLTADDIGKHTGEESNRLTAFRTEAYERVFLVDDVAIYQHTHDQRDACVVITKALSRFIDS